MFAPEKLLHMTHVAKDLSTRRDLETFYLEVFAAQTYYEARPLGALDRDETLIVIGELGLIPQCTTNHDSELGKLRDSYAGRFGQMAIKIPEVVSTESHFCQLGLQPIFVHPDFKKTFFMTDPKETLNIRFEMCAVEMPNDVRLRSEWSADWWRDSHPLHIEGLGSIVTVTDNLEAASRFYQDVLRLQLLAEYKVPEAGATAASFGIGNKVPFVIEVWQPTEDGTPLAEYVAKFGGGIYAVSFKVQSLSAAAGFLESKGLRLVGDSKRRVVIDPSDSFGATFMMMEQDVERDLELA